MTTLLDGNGWNFCAGWRPYRQPAWIWRDAHYGRGIWGEPKDRNEALRVLRRAVGLGVNFIDTADSYGPEVSENLIAEALHPYPKDLIIATKGGSRAPVLTSGLRTDGPNT